MMSWDHKEKRDYAPLLVRWGIAKDAKAARRLKVYISISLFSASLIVFALSFFGDSFVGARPELPPSVAQDLRLYADTH